jgi:hypothetical protein
VAGARWQASLGAGAELGSQRFDLGRIDTRFAGASLAAGPRFVRGPVACDLGLGGEVGGARVDGQAATAGVATAARSALVAAAAAHAGVEAPTGGTLRVRARLQVGRTLRSLIADIDGRPAAGLSGVYVLLGVGVTMGAARSR